MLGSEARFLLLHCGPGCRLAVENMAPVPHNCAKALGLFWTTVIGHSRFKTHFMIGFRDSTEGQHTGSGFPVSDPGCETSFIGQIDRQTCPVSVNQTMEI